MEWRKMLEYSVVFSAGSAGYGALELLWRGHTHWTMLVTGGMCLCSLYIWNKRHPKAPLWQCGLAAGSVITAWELMVGLTVNCLLHWNVWDYSRFRLNVLGQICLPYSILWCLLGIPIRGLCGGLQKYFSKILM